MQPADGDPVRRRWLLNRIPRLGRAQPPSDARNAPLMMDVPEDMEARLARIEAALEALQDQVHRENQRHDRELADLRRAVSTPELAKRLSEDARRRGL